MTHQLTCKYEDDLYPGAVGLWYNSLILAYPNFIIRVGLILNTLLANIAVGSTDKSRSQFPKFKGH